MDKLATEKRAYYLGKGEALHNLGFSEGQIKTAFVREGMSKEAADELVKEAIFQAIGRGIAMGGKHLARAGGRAVARGTSKLMAPAAQGFKGQVGRAGAHAMKTMGGIGRKAGSGIVSSGAAFARNPAKAVGSGVLQAGQGTLFGGGKGMGGMIGKGIFGAQTASMLMPGGETPHIPRPYGMN